MMGRAMIPNGQFSNVGQELSLKRLLIDALIYNSAISALLIGGLATNAEMMVSDYPPDVRARWGAAQRKSHPAGDPIVYPLFAGGDRRLNPIE
jgi:hypothetical protein